MATRESRALQALKKDPGLAAVDSREAMTAPARRSRYQAMATTTTTMRIWSWRFTGVPAGASPNGASASFTVTLVGGR